jgi:hypothetical protein
MTRRLLLCCTLLASTACSDLILGDAGTVNIVDTVTLGAIHGAPLSVPSAYDMIYGLTIRTDQSSSFDFVYDVLPDKGPVFLPLAALGLGTGTVRPAVQKVTTAFDNIINAPTDGWNQTDTVAIAAGDVLVGRSRISCYLGVPQYAKFQVLDFDDVFKTVRLKVLANTNCGYRNLQPGIAKD